MTRKPSPIANILLWLFHALVAIILVADAFAKPIYKPIINWAANLQVMKTLEAQVQRIPRFAVLMLFAVPFAVAEPLKLYALLIMAGGHFMFGLFLLILSYLITFILVERIYHAGKEKLLTYAWFSWCMTHITYVRDKAIAVRQELTAQVKRTFGAFWKSPPRQ